MNFEDEGIEIETSEVGCVSLYIATITTEHLDVGKLNRDRGVRTKEIIVQGIDEDGMFVVGGMSKRIKKIKLHVEKGYDGIRTDLSIYYKSRNSFRDITTKRQEFPFDPPEDIVRYIKHRQLKRDLFKELV